MAEGLLKQVSGGDTIAARFLWAHTFEFKPAFTLWLAANARPRVSANDGALWRRIVQVPFVEQVPEGERDPGLKAYLKGDPKARAAILAWAVHGCLEWQAEGLRVPERVRRYTAEYRAENDSVGEWLDTCCTLDPAGSGQTTVAELRTSYAAWAEENGEKPVASKALGDALRARGCTSTRVRQARAWRGIRLKVTDDG